jgi:hypothetical protein
MAGFLFRLETAAGIAAEPATVSVAVPNMRVGDTIPLAGIGRASHWHPRRRRGSAACSGRGKGGLTLRFREVRRGNRRRCGRGMTAFPSWLALTTTINRVVPCRSFL